MNARHLERRLVVQQREDPRQPPRKHRLAGAGRSCEQQVVPAGGGDLERAACALLAAHVGKIGHTRQRFEVVCGRWRLGRVALAAEVRHRVGEMAHADGCDSGERHLRSRLGGADEMRQPGAAGSFGGHQRTRDRP